jgi:hypothetical protein
MKKALIFLFFITTSKLSFGQLYAEGNMLSVFNDYHIIKPTCKYVEGAKLIIQENYIDVTWKVKGDTVPGYYMIYKSHDFRNIEFIDRLIVPKGMNPNISIVNSTEDPKPNEFYNFYHIIKIKENENISLETINIKDIAIVNLPYVNNNISTKPINKPFSLISSNR